MSSFKPNYFQRRSKPRGPKANERIRALDVQVIGSDGGNLGSMPLNKAIEIAKGEGLDLIEISPCSISLNIKPICPKKYLLFSAWAKLFTQFKSETINFDLYIIFSESGPKKRNEM